MNIVVISSGQALVPQTMTTHESLVQIVKIALSTHYPYCELRNPTSNNKMLDKYLFLFKIHFQLI